MFYCRNDLIISHLDPNGYFYRTRPQARPRLNAYTLIRRHRDVKTTRVAVQILYLRNNDDYLEVLNVNHVVSLISQKNKTVACRYLLFVFIFYLNTTRNELYQTFTEMWRFSNKIIYWIFDKFKFHGRVSIIYNTRNLVLWADHKYHCIFLEYEWDHKTS